jgi:hypothetical protein
MNQNIFNSFADELEKIAAASDWVAPIGGALIGGEIAARGSRKFLKGRYMTPLTLGSSLLGSAIAGDQYNKYRRRRLIKKLRSREARHYRK